MFDWDPLGSALGFALIVVLTFVFFGLREYWHSAKKDSREVRHTGGKIGDPCYTPLQQRHFARMTLLAIAALLAGISGITFTGSDDPSDQRAVTFTEAAHALGLDAGKQYPLVLGSAYGGSSLMVTSSGYGATSRTTTDSTPATGLLIKFTPDGQDGQTLQLPTAQTHWTVIPDTNQQEMFSVTFRDGDISYQDGSVEYHYKPCSVRMRDLVFLWCDHKRTSTLVLSDDMRTHGLATLALGDTADVHLWIHRSTRNKIYGFPQNAAGAAKN